MNVEVRLFATLREYLPEDSSRVAAALELPSGTTIAMVIERLGIPPKRVKLVLVDGRFEADRARVLADGCVLSLFPAVAGG